MLAAALQIAAPRRQPAVARRRLPCAASYRGTQVSMELNQKTERRLHCARAHLSARASARERVLLVTQPAVMAHDAVARLAGCASWPQGCCKPLASRPQCDTPPASRVGPPQIGSLSSNRHFSAGRMAPLLAAVSAPALLAQATAVAGAAPGNCASRVAAQKQHLARSRRASAVTASAVGPGLQRESALATEAADRRAPALVAALAAAVLVSLPARVAVM